MNSDRYLSLKTLTYEVPQEVAIEPQLPIVMKK
jgi:hypothetical protein